MRVSFGPSGDGNTRKRSDNFKAAMRRSAERRTCPACGRKGALSRVEIGPMWSVTSCRWCPHSTERKDGRTTSAGR